MNTTLPPTYLCPDGAPNSALPLAPIILRAAPLCACGRGRLGPQDCCAQCLAEADTEIPPHGLMVCYDHERRLTPITELWSPGDTLESRFARGLHDVFVCGVGGCLSVLLWPEPTCGGAS